MNFSTISTFIKDNYSFLISVVISVVFLIVNIIQAIRTHNISLIKDALRSLPQVISAVEFQIENSEWSLGSKKGQIKKELVIDYLCKTYGRLYLKNKMVFDDAIEDILKTPQKKGGSIDVSQKNEEK